MSLMDLTTAAPASSHAAVPPPSARVSPTLFSSSSSTSPARSATRAQSARRGQPNLPALMSAVVKQGRPWRRRPHRASARGARLADLVLCR